ncbi:tRNA dimethylallyltransferase [subsurface metagenome]
MEAIPLLVILGPTAVGKSEIAISLAKKINGEIVSADSMQLYQGMNLGTAKPSSVEQKVVPHHLIDLLKPDVPFNVFEYAKEAEKIIKEIHQRKKVPILVGGSGLYIRAVVDGLFESPKIDSEKKSIAKEELRNKSTDFLYKELKKVDRKASQKIHPNDRRRIKRALEVFYTAGIPISVLQKKKPNRQFRTLLIGISRQRKELYQRINKRVEAIFAQGFVDEVKTLLENGYTENLNSMQAIGYQETIACLNNERNLAETIELIKKNTRRYAKRQLSWFRQDERINWLSLGNEETPREVITKIEILFRNFLIKLEEKNGEKKNL